jgi:hypothetical protein
MELVRVVVVELPEASLLEAIEWQPQRVQWPYDELERFYLPQSSFVIV